MMILKVKQAIKLKNEYIHCNMFTEELIPMATNYIFFYSHSPPPPKQCAVPLRCKSYYLGPYLQGHYEGS